MRNNTKISLRKANFSDIEFLWYLRNQPRVYRYSRRKGIVGWKEHINWILPIILGESNKELFIIKNSQVPIGQIRFDYRNKNNTEISISICDEFQGKGLAKESLNLAIKKIKNRKRIKKLTAEINKKNSSSIKLFKKLRFKSINKKDKWLIYERRIN